MPNLNDVDNQIPSDTLPAGLTSDEAACRLAINRLPLIGRIRWRRLLAHFGSAVGAWRAPDDAFAAAAGLKGTVTSTILSARRRIDPSEEWERVRGGGYRLLFHGYAGYPIMLEDLDESPPILYCLGDLRASDVRSVALIGSRRADRYGLTVAARLSSELAEAGVTVVSGFARGIDGAAHEGALEAGGRTVAVLGTGLDVIYPREHGRLYERIAASGALLSEFPLGSQPEAAHFPLRNRLISGLAMAVVVVQAAERSGALITVDRAAEQGREVMAVPGDILRPASCGANRLIADGATPVLCGADILHALEGSTLGSAAGIALRPAGIRDAVARIPVRASDRQGTAGVVLNPSEERVLRELGYDPISFDALLVRTGLSVGRAGAALSTLELAGWIRRLPGAFFVRC